MRLREVKIRGFRNLGDVEISLDHRELTTVLLGGNGTGKSNLFEALVTIFRDLDLGEATEGFSYEIAYRCRDREIRIAGGDGKPSPTVDLDGGRLTKKAFTEQRAELLPRHVFAYYSGHSPRMAELFNMHRKAFATGLLNNEDLPLRPLFHARDEHSQYVLLAFFLDPATDFGTLLEDRLGIVGLDDVLFVLGKPEWARGKRAAHPDGDPRFWGARGVVKRFLGQLWDASLAPVRETVEIPSLYSHTSRKDERLYLYLPDIDALQQVGGRYGARDFFKALDSMHIADLFRDVRIGIRRKSADGRITFGQLSEGEQQLLTVLGLLRFTAEEETLFLLDEPDTHLNPEWAYDYLGLIREVVGNDGGTSQLLVATHDPVTVLGLTKEQVRVMEADDERGVRVFEPDDDPRGMGVEGVLLSDVFGLSTTVDRPTLERLDERDALFVKEDRTDVEDERMEQLTQELSGLGFAQPSKDPLYAEYLRLRRAAIPALEGEEAARTVDVARLVRRLLAHLQGAA